VLRLAATRNHQRGTKHHGKQTRAHQNLPESESPACPRPPQGDTAAAAGLFGVVGLAAAYLPARRATRVEVLGVLKEE
jgi:hypothetical protein